MQYTFYFSKQRIYFKFLDVVMASRGKRLRNCVPWRSIKTRLVIISAWYHFSVVLPQGKKIDEMIPQVPFLSFQSKASLHHANQNGGTHAAQPSYPHCHYPQANIFS
jgi:hypothetical protein